MSDEVEWLRSVKTWEFLHFCGVGSPTTEHHLRNALLMGKVRARAAMATISLRGRDGGKRKLTDWEVPPEVWQGKADNSHFDLNSDVYNTGDYSVRMGSVELRGMSFNKTDMSEWFGIELPVVTMLPANGDKGKGGRPPKADEWNNLIAALVVYAQSGPFNWEDQPGETYRKALDFAATLGMDGEAISIDRCQKGILLAKQLIAKAEGKDGEAL